MGASSSVNNPDNSTNPQVNLQPDPRTVNLNHLTQNPRYQQFLRNLYGNNTQIAFIPGSVLMENLGYETLLSGPEIHFKKTNPVSNDFHIDKSSLQLLKDEADNNTYHLTFTFNSSSDGEILVYFDAKEVLDDENNIQLIINGTTQGFETIPHYFQAEKGQRYPHICNKIEVKQITEERLLKVVDDRYPIIIEMGNVIEKDMPRKRYFVYCVLTTNSMGNYGIKMLKQKFDFKGRTYELMNVFDNANSDEAIRDENCAICLMNPIDTFVLPCNHLCLCYNCAKDLKLHHNSRCPMCRKGVDTFLKLEKKPFKKLKQLETKKA